jgi:hypothetical protein
MMRAPHAPCLREELGAEKENILVQRAVGCINFRVVFFEPGAELSHENE